MFDRPGARREPLGDLRVAQPLGQEGKHLQLAIGQPLRICARLWTWPTGEASRATLMKSPSGDLYRRSSAKTLKDSQGHTLGGLIAIKSASACSQGQPSRSQASAAARQSPAISRE